VVVLSLKKESRSCTRGISGVASFITTVNKTEAAIFLCRLCFMRAFPFLVEFKFLHIGNFCRDSLNDDVSLPYNVITFTPADPGGGAPGARPPNGRGPMIF